MATWDRRSVRDQAQLRDAALREQLRDVVGPFSPYWRERFTALGRNPGSIEDADGLATLPAVGERDICPTGDPADAAALVLQPSERGYTLHAPGPQLRQALVRRVFARDSYRRQLEADTRATSYVMGGLGLRFPIASTRSDLDIVARAGARLWQVLGLSSADVVVSGLPPTATAEHQALYYAALATATPALYPGADPFEVAAALRLVPASVFIAASGDAAQFVDDFSQAGAPLGDLTTLLLVGAPSSAERGAVAAACRRAGLDDVRVLGVHAPSGARLLWGECRESAAPGEGSTGYHTYPDLDLVQLVEPETGEPASENGELVLTQLALRGSALVRWRTGDVVGSPITTGSCRACGRTVARVGADLRRGELVPRLALAGGVPRGVDLRVVSGALVGRADLLDWRLVAGARRRGEGDEVVVYVVASEDADSAQVAVGVARDVRTAAGLLPSQVVADESGWLPSARNPVSARIAVRDR